ncbi:PIN domain-containing protein [Cyanobium sp. FGCU-6]|jgi:predicted nucleic acid-binding protein|nr:PIN domain-containing protein [Cyanobium sp. FGCU6]
MRLFLDANVIFTAAHNPNGKAAFLISLAADAGLQFITSDYALEEARRNLSRKAPDALHSLDAMVDAFRVVPDYPALPCPDALPEKDRPIFRAARASADVLLTGDLRDFGPLMNAPDRTDGLLIQTVAEFLNRL